jgi:hypothetical protein
MNASAFFSHVRQLVGDVCPRRWYYLRVEKVTVGSAEMTWDPDARLAVLGFARETTTTGPDAVALVDALSRWIGTEGQPFGLLGDGGRLRGVNAEYRSVWSKFLRDHREDSHAAFFNMSAIVRIAAEMFRIGTGLKLKAFATEEEARAWLRGAGIGA